MSLIIYYIIFNTLLICVCPNTKLKKIQFFDQFIICQYILFLDTAEHIWKSVTSVSNAGKKRGRGKGAGKRRAKNLNRGQVIGVGMSLLFFICELLNYANNINMFLNLAK